MSIFRREEMVVISVGRDSKGKNIGNVVYTLYG
jgi:hypothetical protein